MAFADADFVFGAYHAHGFHAAHLGFLDGDFLVAHPELGADGRHYHRLSGGHVGRAADYLHRVSCAEVYGGDVEMV